ncbi:MAG: hypothetical protein ACI4OZ_04470 [Akkermansia sp.]
MKTSILSALFCLPFIIASPVGLAHAEEENDSATVQQGQEPVCRITIRPRTETGWYKPSASETMTACRGITIPDPRGHHGLSYPALFLHPEKKVIVIQSSQSGSFPETYIYHPAEHRLVSVDYPYLGRGEGDGGGGGKMGQTESVGEYLSFSHALVFCGFDICDFEGRFVADSCMLVHPDRRMRAYQAMLRWYQRILPMGMWKELFELVDIFGPCQYPDNQCYSDAEERPFGTGLWLVSNPSLDKFTDPSLYEMPGTSEHILEYCRKKDEALRSSLFFQTDFELCLRNSDGSIRDTLLKWEPAENELAQQVRSTYGCLTGATPQDDLLFFHWTTAKEDQRTLYAYYRTDGTPVDTGDFRTHLSKEQNGHSFEERWRASSPEYLPQKIGKFGVALLQFRQRENNLYSYIIIRPGCNEVVEIQSPHLLAFLPTLLNGGRELIAVACDEIIGEKEVDNEEEGSSSWEDSFIWTGSYLYHFTLPKAWGEEE